MVHEREPSRSKIVLKRGRTSGRGASLYKTLLSTSQQVWVEVCRPGARFSKVPMINGPGKLSPFTLEIEVSIVLHLTR